MALSEHWRVTMVPVTVAPFVTKGMAADYGWAGRLDEGGLADWIGGVPGHTGVLLWQGAAGLCHRGRHG